MRLRHDAGAAMQWEALFSAMLRKIERSYRAALENRKTLKPQFHEIELQILRADLPQLRRQIRLHKHLHREPDWHQIVLHIEKQIPQQQAFIARR